MLARDEHFGPCPSLAVRPNRGRERAWNHCLWQRGTFSSGTIDFANTWLDQVRRRSSWRHSENDTAWNSSHGGAASLVTPSTALLNRKLAVWKGLRMLKPSAVDLLRQSEKEMSGALRAIPAIESERQSGSRHDVSNLRPARPGVPGQMLVARLLQPSHDVDGSRERHQEGGRGRGTQDADSVAQQCRVVS